MASSTFLASVVSVIGSFIFPQTIKLATEVEAESVPTGVGEVLANLFKGMVANPIGSIVEGRYIGILFWAAVFGIAAKKLASDSTKKLMEDLAEIVSQAVKWIINLAPFGIMGLVFKNVSSEGLSVFTDYESCWVFLWTVC